MKAILRKASAAVIAMAVGSIGIISASAWTGTSGDFKATSSGYGSNLTVALTGYTGSDAEITLPSTVVRDGYETSYDITSVDGAFANNDVITSVTIPDGYDTIAVGSFKNCTNLKKVVIPGSVTMIGANAFEGCTALEEVVFEADTASSFRMMLKVFYGCGSLKKLSVPTRLNTAIYDFTWGSGIEELSVNGESSTVKAVDNALYLISGDEAKLIAYPGGSSAKEFTIASEIDGVPVTAIVMHAFEEANNLEKVTVPAGVSTINSFNFYNMTALKEVVLKGEEAPSFSEGYAFAQLPAGCVIKVANEDVKAAVEAKTSNEVVVASSAAPTFDYIRTDYTNEGSNQAVTFITTVAPAGSALSLKWTARAGEHSDEKALPTIQGDTIVTVGLIVEVASADITAADVTAELSVQ